MHMARLHQTGDESSKDYNASPEFDETWRLLTMHQAPECARGFETHIKKVWRRAGPMRWVDWSGVERETKKTNGFNWAALPARWILSTFLDFWTKPADILLSDSEAGMEECSWVEHLLQYRTVHDGVPLLKTKTTGKSGGKKGSKKGRGTEVAGIGDGLTELSDEMKARARALWTKIMWAAFNGQGGTKPFERNELAARRNAMVAGDKMEIPASIRTKLIRFEKELGPPGTLLCAYCGEGFKPDPADPNGPNHSFDTNCGGGHIWTDCPHKEAGMAEAAAQQARGRASRKAKRESEIGGLQDSEDESTGGPATPKPKASGSKKGLAKCSVPLENLDSSGKLKPELHNEGEACTVAGLTEHYVGDVVFAGLSTNHKCGLADAHHPTQKQVAALSKSRGVDLVFDPSARLDSDADECENLGHFRINKAGF